MNKSKYKIYSFSEVDAIPQKNIVKYYKNYVNPGIASLLHILGFDKFKIERAEGMYLYTNCGRRILDFSAGMNVLNCGHNHPDILKVRRIFNERKNLEICKAFISQYQSVLAKNLKEVFPGDLKYSFFCNSGAEANEGALKIALLYQGPEKDKIIHTDLGVHGKTFGAMSVSGSGVKSYKELFKNIKGCIEVPYGNIDAVKDMIKRRSNGRSNDIAAIIIEAIKGDLVMVPPRGYLKDLSKICKEHKIILIIDEIFTGFGRTGKMFAFEHEGIIPDIVTFSKALGGGKASISGYIVKSKIFKNTYASLDRCMIHTTTYGGLGEECATAIEAINIVDREGLVERSRIQGEYLLSRMKAIKNKYPEYIKEARGIGLLCIFELYKSSEILGRKISSRLRIPEDKVSGLFPAMIIAEMLNKYNCLLYTGSRMDILFLNPALIVERYQIDSFMDALDGVLGKNPLKLAMRLLKNYIV